MREQRIGFLTGEGQAPCVDLQQFVRQHEAGEVPRRALPAADPYLQSAAGQRQQPVDPVVELVISLGGKIVQHQTQRLVQASQQGLRISIAIQRLRQPRTEFIQ
ncbi:hypothetical protein D9M73_273370 [compost metagenome]